MKRAIKLLGHRRPPQQSNVRYLITSQFKSNMPTIKKEKLISVFEKSKLLCQNYEPKEFINPNGIFANNELDLKDIQVYGFDYDYTLAYYNVSLYQLIFNLARDVLVDTYKYPDGIKNLLYLPNFPIRGLHLDKRKGWLMKIDSYHNIQMGTVYHGMNSVDDDDVVKFFNGNRLNIDHIGHTQSSKTHHHFVDLFCLPEVSLLSGTYQFFLDRGIHFNPEYVFQDVHDVVNSIHKNQLLHRHIVQSIDDYLLPIVDENHNSSSSIYIKELLIRLNKNGKKLFLVTNSNFWFVNIGMQSLCGSDWTSLFDLIICNANKPYFFTSKTKPFRQFNIKTNSKTWERVSSFKKGDIYYEGNLFEMLENTGWQQNQVLYFGDHIYGDLADPFLKHGLRTGAILNETEQEVKIINTKEYQQNALWLVILEKLIEKSMLIEEDIDLSALNSSAVAAESSSLSSLSMSELRKILLDEREKSRQASKKFFNPYFGSVFRSHHNPSFFSRRLSRFADIYTSNVSNLLNYPIDCLFIPRRVDLAHELSNKIDLDLD